MKTLSLYNDLKKQSNKTIIRLKLKHFKKRYLGINNCKSKSNKTY